MSINIIELIGDALIVSGEIMIAYMVIAVHTRVCEEHQMDEEVFKIMKKEHLLGTMSILMLVVGFALRTLAKHIL